MLIKTFYVCEICHSEYDAEESAKKCEALGFPEPMPFLAWGEMIPAFGENGVEWAELESVYIIGNGDYDHSFKHHWMVHSSPTPRLSHNRSEYNATPAMAFDPRYGWDAFRYNCTADDIMVWDEALKKGGFTRNDCEYITSMRPKLKTISIKKK